MLKGPVVQTVKTGFKYSFLAAVILLLPAILTIRLAWAEANPAAADAHATSSHLSRSAAVAFQHKLMELSQPASSLPTTPKPVVVTDAEVNSYLKYYRQPFLPPSVEGLTIHFKPAGVFGEAQVNFDTLQPAKPGSNDLGSMLMASIFTGTQQVSALGVIASSNGSAKLTLQAVRIGSVELSDWLVNWLLQTYVESQYHLDLSKPFLLPAQVSRIDFASGKAIFVRRRVDKKR